MVNASAELALMVMAVMIQNDLSAMRADEGASGVRVCAAKVLQKTSAVTTYFIGPRFGGRTHRHTPWFSRSCWCSGHRGYGPRAHSSILIALEGGTGTFGHLERVTLREVRAFDRNFPKRHWFVPPAARSDCVSELQTARSKSDREDRISDVSRPELVVCHNGNKVGNALLGRRIVNLSSGTLGEPFQ